MTRLHAAIAICMGAAFATPAEASIPRDLSRSPFSIKAITDPFAAAPPSLTQGVRALEERQAAASECVALCDLAASVETHPFGVASAEPPNRSEDAWGNYRFTSEVETSHNRFGFTGHYWDKEASLYYAKARYYDPFTARFTQADSFLGSIDEPPSLHRYFYANANPTFYVDPTGHDAAAIESELAFPGQRSAPGWGERFLAAWPGAIARTVTEGVAATGRFGLRLLTSLQRPGSTADQFNDRIPELRRLGQSDLDAVKGEARFYHQTLANLPKTGPAALDAISELGPEGTAHGLANATVMTLGGIEGGVGVVRGVTRGVALAESGLESARASIATFTDGLPGRNLLNSELYLKPVQGMGSEIVPGASLLGRVGLRSSTRLRDPMTGRFVEDPLNPRSPYTFTDAQRRAAWRGIAEDPNSAISLEQRVEIKARGWRGPRQYNEYGELETMELSHEPVPLREAGTEVVPRWPADHAAVDPSRKLKKRE